MRKRTSVLVLTALFFFSTGMVVVVFLETSNKTNYQYNSFSRKFITNAVSLSNQLDIKYNSYYLAGATSRNIYFGNVTAPWHILITDAVLADTQHVQLNIKNQHNLEFRSISVTVDSPYFHFTDGSIPAIFRGTTESWKGAPYSYNGSPFITSIPINETSLAIQTVSSKTKEFTIGKLMKIPPYVKLAPELLEKQIDGRFCVDGMLHYNKDLACLVYVYYYRNQFIVADTSLNLLYRGNTIDTISKAKIRVAKIKSENANTMAIPPLIVNKKSCVSGSWLLVNSNLLAKNEDIKMFESGSVIDVYNLRGGEYQFSFYLPFHEGKKMREFNVFGDMLIALYDHYALKYQLNPKYFGGNARIMDENTVQE